MAGIYFFSKRVINKNLFLLYTVHVILLSVSVTSGHSSVFYQYRATRQQLFHWRLTCVHWCACLSKVRSQQKVFVVRNNRLQNPISSYFSYSSVKPFDCPLGGGGSWYFRAGSKLDSTWPESTTLSKDIIVRFIGFWEVVCVLCKLIFRLLLLLKFFQVSDALSDTM